MNRPIPLAMVAAIFVGTLLLSCVRHHRLTSPAQISQLPASHGVNMGSIIAPTPWQYLGSKENTHEFRYYFNKEGTLCHHQVSIPRSSAKLKFPEFAYKSKTAWVELCHDDQTFKIAPHTQPSPFRDHKFLEPASPH